MSPQLPTVLLRAQTDERLVRLAALGSERAFEAIVERYRRPLLGYARRIAGESRAEDVVQAAFVGAWGRLVDGTEVRDLRAWLFRIVHNGAINAVKRASASDVELFDDTPGTGDLHAEIERRDDVRRALDGIAALPLQQREALLGVAVQGRRHRDVGAELGVTDGAVRMLLHRARSTMRTAATALTPWPLLGWVSSSKVTAGGAGAGALATGGLKAAVVLSTAAVAVTAAPSLTARPATPARPPAAVASLTASPIAASPIAGAPRASAPAASAPTTSAPEPRAHVTPPDTDPAGVEPVPGVPAPAPGIVQQEDSTTLAPAEPKERFLQTAEGEDDEIAVEEEPPDLAAGEQPIPAGGVPDAIGEASLPEQPAAAQDERELAAEDAPADPAPASDAATSAPAPGA